MIAVEPVLPIKNTPYSTSLILCKTNIKDYQYNTEVAIDHYLYQDNVALCISIYFIRQFWWL